MFLTAQRSGKMFKFYFFQETIIPVLFNILFLAISAIGLTILNLKPSQIIPQIHRFGGNTEKKQTDRQIGSFIKLP